MERPYDDENLPLRFLIALARTAFLIWPTVKRSRKRAETPAN